VSCSLNAVAFEFLDILASHSSLFYTFEVKNLLFTAIVTSKNNPPQNNDKKMVEIIEVMFDWF